MNEIIHLIVDGTNTHWAWTICEPISINVKVDWVLVNINLLVIEAKISPQSATTVGKFPPAGLVSQLSIDLPHPLFDPSSQDFFDYFLLVLNNDLHVTIGSKIMIPAIYWD